LLEDHAKTTPIPRFAREQALRVKPMLDGRLRRQKIHIKAIINYVKPMLDGRFQRRENRNLIEFTSTIKIWEQI